MGIAGTEAREHPSAVAARGPALWRAHLAEGRARLRAAFLARSDPPRLLRGLARLTDEVVVAAWKEAAIPSAALVAVGGYGR